MTNALIYTFIVRNPDGAMDVIASWDRHLGRIEVANLLREFIGDVSDSAAAFAAANDEGWQIDEYAGVPIGTSE